MRRARFAVPMAAVLLVVLASCDNDKVLVASDNSCAGKKQAGPELAVSKSYIVVAHDRAETWAAVEDVDEAEHSPMLAPGHGLLGQAPNDLEYRHGRIYALNSQSNSLQVIEAFSGLTLACLDLGAGTSPWELAMDPQKDQNAWITTFASGELLEIDLRELRVLRRRTIGSGLEGLWVSEATVAVTLTGFNGTEGSYGAGSVLILDKDTLQEIRRLPVPTNPQFLLAGPGGRLHVLCTGNYGQQEPAAWGRVVRLSTDWASVTDTLVLGGTPGHAALAPDGTVFVAGWSGGLTAYNGATFTLLRGSDHPIENAVGYTDVVVGKLGVYAANFDADALLVVDPRTLLPTGHLLTGDGPSALVAIPPR